MHVLPPRPMASVSIGLRTNMVASAHSAMASPPFLLPRSHSLSTRQHPMLQPSRRRAASGRGILWSERKFPNDIFSCCFFFGAAKCQVSKSVALRYRTCGASPARRKQSCALTHDCGWSRQHSVRSALVNVIGERFVLPPRADPVVVGAFVRAGQRAEEEYLPKVEVWSPMKGHSDTTSPDTPRRTRITSWPLWRHATPKQSYVAV